MVSPGQDAKVSSNQVTQVHVNWISTSADVNLISDLQDTSKAALCDNRTNKSYLDYKVKFMNNKENTLQTLQHVELNQ